VHRTHSPRQPVLGTGTPSTRAVDEPHTRQIPLQALCWCSLDAFPETPSVDKDFDVSVFTEVLCLVLSSTADATIPGPLPPVTREVIRHGTIHLERLDDKPFSGNLAQN